MIDLSENDEFYDENYYYVMQIVKIQKLVLSLNPDT